MPSSRRAWVSTTATSDKMRAEVRANLEREVKRRVQARVKDQVMKALLETSTLEVPKALVDMEIERLMAQMAREPARRAA